MAHTGKYIANCIISTMLDKCDISYDNVHLVLSDNASNMVKVMQDASLPHFGCVLPIQYNLLSCYHRRLLLI